MVLENFRQISGTGINNCLALAQVCTCPSAILVFEWKHLYKKD